MTAAINASSRGNLTASALRAWSDFAGPAAEAAPAVRDHVKAAAADAGGSPAVVDSSRTITYSELAALIDELAEVLVSAGVQPGQVVGLADPLDAAGCAALLAVVSLGSVPVVVRDGPEAGPPADWSLTWEGSQQAVVIRQPGSPPTPGEAPPDPGWNLLASGLVKRCALDHDDVVALLPGLEAAATLRRVLAAWEAGGSVAIAPWHAEFAPAQVLDWAFHAGVTHLDVERLWWNGAVACLEEEDRTVSLPRLRRVLVSGPAPPPRLVERWRARVSSPAATWAVFQPASTSQATLRRVDEETAPFGRAGRPLPGSAFAVVDRHGRLCSPLIPGRVLAGGSPSDLAAGPGPPGASQPWVETGASGRLVTSGTGGWELEVLYERDDDGTRLAKALWHVDGVVDVVVIPPSDGSAGALVAGEHGVDRDLLDAALGEALPGSVRAALPDSWHDLRLSVVPRIPRGADGEPEQTAARELLRATTLPRRGLEDDPARPVAGERSNAARLVWQQVLGVTRVGDNDDFFRLGGSSLTALRLVAVLRERLGVPVRASDLYGRSQFASFAGWLAKLADLSKAADQTDDAVSPLAIVEVGSRAELLDRISRPDDPLAGDQRAVPRLVVTATGHADPDVGLVEGFHHLRLEVADASQAAVLVARLVALHPLLRSRALVRGDGWAHALVERDPPLLVLLTERETPAISHLVRDQLVVAYEPASHSPLRAAVVRDAGSTVLHVWVSHTVCDGEAAALLRRQLGDLASGKGPAHLATTVNELEAYASQLAERRTPKSDAEEQRRVEQFQQARAGLSAAGADRGPGASSSWRRRMGAEPVTPLATALTVLSHALGVPRLPLLCDFHGRVDPRAVSLVGNYAGYLPVVVETGDRRPAEVVPELRGELEGLRDRYPSWRSTPLGALSDCVRVSIFEASADGLDDTDAGASDAVEVTVLLDGGEAELVMSAPWPLDDVLRGFDGLWRGA